MCVVIGVLRKTSTDVLLDNRESQRALKPFIDLCK